MSHFVIRPGETDFDSQDRIQGALDLPMNASGLAQVEEMAKELKDVDLAVIYTSPSEPAYTTAQHLGMQLHIPVKVLDGLANFDLGLWQGLSRSEIRHKQPRVFKQWEEAPESVCPPCGEPPEEVLTRIDKALRKPIRRKHPFAVVASEPLASLIICKLRGDSSCQSIRLAQNAGTCSRIDHPQPAGA